MERWKEICVFLVFFGVACGADFASNNSLIEYYGNSDNKINLYYPNSIL